MTKKFKFNIIDFIIIALIIAAVAFFCVKFLGGSETGSTAEGSNVRVTFYCEECPAYVPQNTQIGDSMYAMNESTYLGTVVDVQTGESVVYVEAADGSIVTSTKENHVSCTITTELYGTTLNAYGIQAGSVTILSGHSLTVYAGGGKYYGKIVSIEPIE